MSVCTQQVSKNGITKRLVTASAPACSCHYADRYVNDEFSQTHQPTVGVDFFIKEFVLENGPSISSPGSVVRVQLWDIAGQDRAKKVNRVSELHMSH